MSFVQMQLGHEHASTTGIYTIAAPDYRSRELHRVLSATLERSEGTLPSPTTKTTDLEGHPVHITTNAPTPEQITRMNVQPTGERFIIPAVGLNVPLSALNDVDNTNTPTHVSSHGWVFSDQCDQEHHHVGLPHG